MNRIISVTIAIILLSACMPSPKPERMVDIVRLDRAIDADSLPADLIPAADAWLAATTGISNPSPEKRDSLLRKQAESEAFRVFAPDVESRLPSLLPTMTALARLDSVPARIYGVISPFRQSVVIVDTMVFVALNHYLGEDYPGYSSFPLHQRRLKRSDRIPLDVAEALTATRMPFPDSIAAPTVQQRIVYEGALLALVADRLGLPDGEELMGWTPEQWADAVSHEDEAWKRLVAGGLLFNDSQDIISRLTAPAPSSPDISPDAPGRLGRFIGLRIVRASDIDPAEILLTKAYLSTDIIAPYAQARR